MTGMMWSALGLGFLGSVHCIGMCGPIALALPRSLGALPNLLLSRITYNLGRILTYSILGLLCGLVGQLISFAGLQRWLSITAGVLILAVILVPRLMPAKVGSSRVVGSIVNRFRSIWGRLFSSRSLPGLFGVGLLNGLLPCGLVYVALAAAIATGTPMQGAGYMALFGFGTFPAMFAISVFGSAIPVKTRQSLVRLMPVGATVLALLLILRGMSLGIPYVSPKLHSGDPQANTQKHDCCK
jgi:uncharacterized protein